MPTDDELIVEHANISNALALVFDAIAIASKALLKNPSPSARRRINNRIARLQGEAAMLRAKLDALEAGQSGVSGPTLSQLKTVSGLTREVEDMTTAQLTVADALSVASRVLRLSSKISDV